MQRGAKTWSRGGDRREKTERQKKEERENAGGGKKNVEAGRL